MAVRSALEYRAQLMQLLPPGPAWDPDLYPLPAMVLDAVADELARVDARAGDLLTEMFPGSIRQLLADWERVMDLPGACLGAGSSVSDRVREVVRRFADVGRQDRAYFESLAHGLGYPDATIIEWRTPRFGMARFGAARFAGWECQYVWVIMLGARRVQSPLFGAAQFGDRFGGNPNDIVECVIRSYAPAHTVVLFNYE